MYIADILILNFAPLAPLSVPDVARFLYTDINCPATIMYSISTQLDALHDNLMCVGSELTALPLSAPYMVTSSNGNIFRVTSHLCGNSPVTGEFPAKGPRRGALMFYLICAWINGWGNIHESGDLRCCCAHCDVTVMLPIDLWNSNLVSFVLTDVLAHQR